MKERIHIFYTNDLHSHFKNWPKAATFLKEKRQKAKTLGEYSLTVDIGDHMDRGDSLTDATLGQANVSLLNHAGYDVVTLGNNEGITLSHDALFHLYDHAAFDVVCSNLTNTEEENPLWLKDYTIHESPSGVRIGLFGLTAPFNFFYNLLGWNIEEVMLTIERMLNELKEEADIIILLSHLGIHEDRMIAEKFPEIDVIIGGHTHHLLKTGEEVGNAILTAAGKTVTYAGEVTLTWDHQEKKLIQKEAHASNITHLEPDEATVKHLDYWQRRADIIAEKPVVVTSQPLLVDWDKETPIIKAMTETLLNWTGADVAMLNAGLLLGSLGAGTVTHKDIHAICPHPINPVVVGLTGNRLMEVVRATLTDDFINLELKGFGFRGKRLGRMVFAGIEVQTERHHDGHLYVKELYFQGETLTKDRMYYIATGDLFMFGTLLPPVARSSFKKLFLPEFIRDILTETLRSNDV